MRQPAHPTRSRPGIAKNLFALHCNRRSLLAKRLRQHPRLSSPRAPGLTMREKRACTVANSGRSAASAPLCSNVPCNEHHDAAGIAAFSTSEEPHPLVASRSPAARGFRNQGSVTRELAPIASATVRRISARVGAQCFGETHVLRKCTARVTAAALRAAHRRQVEQGMPLERAVRWGWRPPLRSSSHAPPGRPRAAPRTRACGEP